MIEWNIGIVPNTGCIEGWQCQWTECEKNDEYSYSYACEDRNECGTNLLKPYRQLCGNVSVWDCGDWGVCEVRYSLQDVLEFDFKPVKGTQERFCTDLKGLRDGRSETRACDIGTSISARKVLWCEEEYVELYNKGTEELISRIKESLMKDFRRLDISFISTNFEGYCGYCYDGIKNFDEKDIDCGGKNCLECISLRDYVNYILYIKWALWILLLLLLLLLL